MWRGRLIFPDSRGTPLSRGADGMVVRVKHCEKTRASCHPQLHMAAICKDKGREIRKGENLAHVWVHLKKR